MGLPAWFESTGSPPFNKGENMENETNVKVVMDPVSLFYLSLGQVSGSIMRPEVVENLKDKGATEAQIKAFQTAAMDLAQTAYN